MTPPDQGRSSTCDAAQQATRRDPREVEPDGPAQLLVGLDVEGERLLARITRRSGAALGIAPGRRVFAQVKSAALVR